MRLDDVIASQKRSALMLGAMIGGLLLAVLVPPLRAWQMTAMCMPGAVTQWLISSRGCRPWAGLLSGWLVAGSVLSDYLFQQSAPVVSPYLFLGVWFVVMAPFAFWLTGKEKRAMATGEREETTRV